MGISPFYKSIRDKVGHSLLLIPAVAGIVRDPERRILVQQQHDDQWSLPAGAIEPGEQPSEAVVREVFEETGLLVRPVRVVAVLGGSNCRVTYPNGDAVEYNVTVFECDPIGGSLLAQETDETKRLEYVNPSELSKLSFPYPSTVFDEKRKEAYFELMDGPMPRSDA